MALPDWVQDNFERVKRIAARHDMRCPLRVAIVSGDETKVCACNGKLNVFGVPKTKPRERTLEDVRRQVVR